MKFQVFNTCSRFMLAFTIFLTYNENLYTDWKVFHMQWYWGSTSGSTDAFPDVQWVSTQRTLPLLCIYLIFLWCFLLNCVICMLTTFQHNWKGRSLWLHACINQFSFWTPSRNFHYELFEKSLGSYHVIQPWDGRKGSLLSKESMQTWMTMKIISRTRHPPLYIETVHW